MANDEDSSGMCLTIIRKIQEIAWRAFWNINGKTKHFHLVRKKIKNIQGKSYRLGDCFITRIKGSFSTTV